MEIWDNTELRSNITEQDLLERNLLPDVDKYTGQPYCHCVVRNCPLSLSFDRIDSNLPHIISNLQPLLACLNLYKGDTRNDDFIVRINDFRERNSSLICCPPPQLEEPITKLCSGCQKNLPFDSYNNCIASGDGLSSECKVCRSERYPKKAPKTAPTNLPKKKCTGCKEILASECFSKRGFNNGVQRWRTQCKKCLAKPSTPRTFYR